MNEGPIEKIDVLPLQHPHEHMLSGWRFKALIATVILSIIGYLLFSLWGGWNDVVIAVDTVGTMGIVVALSLSLVNYALRFKRWQSFLNVLGHGDIPWFKNLRIYLAGFALTTTPGKAGEAFRSVFLKDYDVSYRKSFGAFLAERLSDLISVVVLSAGGLWFYPSARPVVIITGIIIAICIYALQNNSWLKWSERILKKILPSRLSHMAEFFIETILAFRSCFKTSVLLYGVLLGVLAWAVEGIAFYYMLQLLHMEQITLFTALFIYAFSLLIGAVTLLPGGLGGAEVTMLQLLILNGAPASSAVAVTIVIRLTTLWFSVLLGLLAMPKLKLIHH